MSTLYEEYKKQIAELQEIAEAVRRTEISEARAKIQALITVDPSEVHHDREDIEFQG